MMNDTSGLTCGKQFAIYDLDTSSWRTWPATGLWDSIEFSGTWPKMGYMRDGLAYELPMSALPTTENDCSSSQLLPTPKASDGMRGYGLAEHRRRSPALGSVMTYYRDGSVCAAQPLSLRIAEADSTPNTRNG